MVKNKNDDGSLIKREERYPVRLTTEEKKKVEELAALYGMKKAPYMRAVALQHKLVPLIDLESIKQLNKVNNDLARLGNLLKYWLANDVKLQVATRMKIENRLPEILDEIHNERMAIHKIVKSINSKLRSNNETFGVIDDLQKNSKT